jgi:PAS domain S-box-containing protein
MHTRIRLSGRIRLRSIRSRLLAAFIVLVLAPTVLVSLVFAFVSFHSGKREIITHLETIAALKESEIRTWVEGLRADLALAASGAEAFSWMRAVLREPVPDEGGGSKAARTARERSSMLLRDRFLGITELISRPRLKELFLLDTQGRVVLSTAIWNEDMRLHDADFFQQGLLREQVHVEPLALRGSGQGEWAVIVSRPVFDARGEVLGVLCGRAGLDRLNAIMLERSGLGRTGETYLLGEGAVMLTDSRFTGHGPGSVLGGEYQEFARFDHPHARGAIYQDYRGKRVIGVHRVFSDLEMTLVAEIDLQEAFAPVALTLLICGVVVLAALVLAVLASAVFTRRLSARLSGLVDAAGRMARGDMSRPAEVAGCDEVSQAAAAFNAMTERLERRFEAERLVAMTSRQLLKISPQDMEHRVERALSGIATFLNVDGALVFQASEDGARVWCGHEWMDEGVPSLKSRLPEVELPSYPWFWERFSREGAVKVPACSLLPVDAGPERWFCEEFGIKAGLVAPMIQAGRHDGFLAVVTVWGERGWLEEELALLRILADIVGNALERCHAQEALHRSEERYALAQKAANIGSWDWDIPSGKLYWSDAIEPMFGHAPGAFKNTFRSFLRFVHREDRAALVQAIRTAFETDQVYDIEHRIVRADGAVRWVNASGAVIRDQQDMPVRMLGILRDITKRKQAEEALEAMNRGLEATVEERTRDLERKAEELQRANQRLRELDTLKSSFLASVSHEFRTPLTSILGFAKMIQRDFRRHYQDAPNAKAGKDRGIRIQDNLEIILHEGERLTRLVNDVLDLTKIESGKVEWRDCEVSLAECVARAVSAVQGQLAARPGVTLEVDVPRELPTLFMDPDRLSQVLINLLNNAAKFTSKGGIRISADLKDEETLRIRVRDTGCGIPAEEIAMIFDTFHQATRYDTLANKPEGTGLGLSISRQIVEHYRGRIWAESQEGAGSVFIVELPTRPQPAEPLESDLSEVN